MNFMHNYSNGVKVSHFSISQSVKVAKNTTKINCIDFSVFLEPACGEGNFCKEILKRKLVFCQSKLR